MTTETQKPRPGLMLVTTVVVMLPVAAYLLAAYSLAHYPFKAGPPFTNPEQVTTPAAGK